MRKVIVLSILLTFSNFCIAGELASSVNGWSCYALPKTTEGVSDVVKSVGWAFAELVKRESPRVWWDCGEKTPADQWHKRGEEIVQETMNAMYKKQLCVDPVGVVATAWNESRGNACSIGPRTRRAASKAGLLPKGKSWATYNREEILAILDSPKWISRGYVADVGVYQDVFPRYARILDKDGELTCLGKRKEPCRVPKTAELVQVSTSAEVGIHGMLSRYYFFRTREPWVYWPWTVRQSYSTAIKATIKNLNSLVQKYKQKHATIS
jgi:hypothetical protein